MASLFGGDGGIMPKAMDSREASTMSLLQAMQQVQEAGTRRTASPIGAIAQALIPIFSAPIQARQMQQESALKSLLAKATIAKALSGLQGNVRGPEQVDLDKARAEAARAQAAKYRADATAPFGGQSPTSVQLAEGKLRNDPRLAPLHDFIQAQEQQKMAAQAAATTDRASLLQDRAAERAETKRRQKSLSTTEAFLHPITGVRLNPRTVGDLEDLPFEPKRLPTRQASKISDIRTAHRELKALRGSGEKVLYDIKPGDGSLIGDLFGVGGKRAKAAIKSKAGDPDVKQFEAYQMSFPLALSKALQETSRQPPVAEFGAVKNISNTDSVQSMAAKLDKAEEWLVGVLHDYGFQDPYSVLNEGPVALGARPVAAHSAPEMLVPTPSPGKVPISPEAASGTVMATPEAIPAEVSKYVDELRAKNYSEAETLELVKRKFGSKGSR